MNASKPKPKPKSSLTAPLPTLIQRYSSLSAFCRHHRLQVLPRPHATWRLVAQPVLGSVNGLERSYYGIAMATNGVIVAIETPAYTILFAHLQWFVKDDPDAETDLDLSMAAVRQARIKMQTLSEFNDLFVDEVL